MKNSKVTKFEKKISTIVSEQKEKMLNHVNKHLSSLNEMEFKKFDNENPYSGETKNKISNSANGVFFHLDPLQSKSLRKLLIQ